mmetsp:Transcript_41657/g.109993  ORF Transcript_41657/g.109993 Transcript_41657/m.109993 type:complete len:281 (-) Transcript_41657:44-886(-)
MELPGLRVGHLLEHGDGGEPREELPEAVLRQAGDLGEDHGGQGPVGEGERREEPGRGVPDLGLGGEPSLRQGVVQQGVEPGGAPGALRPAVRQHEHRRERRRHEEVQGVVAHDLLPEELLGLGQLLPVMAPLPDVRRHVAGDVAGDDEEATDEHVLLRQELQQQPVLGAELDEVADDDRQHEGEPAAVDAVDPRLGGLDDGERRLLGGLGPRVGLAPHGGGRRGVRRALPVPGLRGGQRVVVVVVLEGRLAHVPPGASGAGEHLVGCAGRRERPKGGVWV